MTTLRIYDHGYSGILSVDLSGLIDVLAPRSLEARWKVSPVTLRDPRLGRSVDEWMVVESAKDGDGLMEQFARKSFATGHVLSEAAHSTDQIIWGQFVGTLPGQSESPWIVIRAIDSTFYEVSSVDEAVIAAVRAAYNDVRFAPGPVTSIPIE